MATLQRPGLYFALLIGISDYRAPVPKLRTPIQDAKEIDRILRDQYGFETKLLLNADATHDKIKRALNEFRSTMSDDGNLLVYYAGHGQYDVLTKKSYWLPFDADANDDTHWIMADDITAAIRAIPAKHILIISDSCYSGGIVNSRAVDYRWSEHDWKQYLQKMMRDRSRTVMASGGVEPVDDSGPGGHSIFAQALIQGLTSIEENAYPTEDLFDRFVKRRVAGASGQVPEYDFIRDSNHVDGDFVFFRNH